MPSDYKAITKYNEEQLGRDTASRKTQISMYSDSTHFIYEILQNADDSGAKQVLFKLSERELLIEHDGDPFTEENVKAITYFGQSTSREDLVKTGRFGVGFKSVFAFTATPVIVSNCEHFQIYDLYRVKEYPYPDDLRRPRTRIILPFNHESKKPDFVEDLVSQAEAYSKIEERLTSLNKSTLLFTQNIREIRWKTNDGSGHYSREDDINDRIRMTSITDGEHVKRYLVFSREPKWNGEVHKTVDVAFLIDEKGAIAPVTSGEDFLYVLFATKQETHLRFLLNGPYRTNPARETISEDDSFNRHLIKETGDLVEDMLPEIREKGLLTPEFLGVLPNRCDDDLRDFYEPIMDRIVEVFKNEQLIPMERGGHAAASGIYRGRRQFSGLIKDEDLTRILGKNKSLPLWVATTSARSHRTNNFQSSLGISKWDENDLIRELAERPDLVKSWLKEKSDEWHQEFYALLGDFLSKTYGINRTNLQNELSNLPILRLNDGCTYKRGEDCYFPSDDVEQDEKFPRIRKDSYSSGSNKDLNEKVRKFLQEIGVSEVGEVEQIEAILKQRYVKGTINLRQQHHEKDLKRFITLIEDEPNQANLFAGYFIFELDNGRWGKPSAHVFLDRPYLDTGLRAYYGASVNNPDRKQALSSKYETYDIEAERLGRFAKKVGSQTALKVEEQKIPTKHPQYNQLMSAPGARRGNVMNIDYTISAFSVLLQGPKLDKAWLIWRTMNSLSSEYLTAKYRKSESGGFRCAASSLVYALRKSEWVPQDHGESLRFVRPCEASDKLLPEGFSYHPTREWISKIEFGENVRKKSEDHSTLARNAKEMGFDNADDAKKWAELKKMGLSPDEVLSTLTPSREFPTGSVGNPERRRARLGEQLHDASEKNYELEQRSVRTTRREIDPSVYLRNLYTKDDDRMFCQICQREMPFRKPDGEYYFEAVESLSVDYLPKEHQAQFLALCPECAARYKVFVKNDEGAMGGLHGSLKEFDDLEIPLELGEWGTSLRFVKTHRHDIKTILQENSFIPQ